MIQRAEKKLQSKEDHISLFFLYIARQDEDCQERCSEDSLPLDPPAPADNEAGQMQEVAIPMPPNQGSPLNNS